MFSVGIPGWITLLFVFLAYSPSLFLPVSMVDDLFHLSRAERVVTAWADGGLQGFWSVFMEFSRSYPGLIATILAVTKYIMFGDIIWLWHVPTLMCLLLTCVLTMAVVRCLGGSRAASIIAVLLAVFFAPVQWNWQRQAFPANWFRIVTGDRIMIFLGLLTTVIVLFMLRSIEKGHRIRGSRILLLIIAGLSMMVAVLVKAVSVSYIPPLVVIVLLLWLIKSWRQYAASSAVIIAFPAAGCILGFITHFLLSSTELTGYTSDYNLRDPLAMWGHIQEYWSFMKDGWGLLLWWGVLLIAAEIYRRFANHKQRPSLSLGYLLLLLLTISALLFQSPWRFVLPRYMCSFVFPAAILMALAFDPVWEQIKSIKFDHHNTLYGVSITLVLLVIVCFMVFACWLIRVVVLAIAVIVGWLIVLRKRKNPEIMSRLRSPAFHLFIFLITVGLLLIFAVSSSFSFPKFVVNYTTGENVYVESIHLALDIAEPGSTIYFADNKTEIGIHCAQYVEEFGNEAGFSANLFYPGANTSLRPDDVVVLNVEKSPYVAGSSGIAAYTTEPPAGAQESSAHFITSVPIIQAFQVGTTDLVLMGITLPFDSNYMSKGEAIHVQILDAEGEHLMGEAVFSGSEHQGKTSGTNFIDFKPPVRFPKTGVYLLKVWHTDSTGKFAGRKTILLTVEGPHLYAASEGDNVLNGFLACYFHWTPPETFELVKHIDKRVVFLTWTPWHEIMGHIWHGSVWNNKSKLRPLKEQHDYEAYIYTIRRTINFK